MKIDGNYAYPETLREAAVFGEQDAKAYIAGEPYPLERDQVSEAMRAVRDEPVIVDIGTEWVFLNCWKRAHVGRRVIACNAVTSGPNLDELIEWAHPVEAVAQ